MEAQAGVQLLTPRGAIASHLPHVLGEGFEALAIGRDFLSFQPPFASQAPPPVLYHAEWLPCALRNSWSRSLSVPSAKIWTVRDE